MNGQIITVDFRNDTIFAVEEPDGVFVALKPICDSLGLSWRGQQERVNRDAILAEGTRIIRLPSVGGVQETTCLKLDLLNGWLFTIDETRVKDEATRLRVLAYKRECYRVLNERFNPAPKTEPIEPTVTPPLPEHRAFPDWPLEEMRTKDQTVDRYQRLYGVLGAQWIAPQLGFPVPPPELIERGRQLVLVFGELPGEQA